PWLPPTILSTALPSHCTPENDFLLQLSRTFNTCIPTPLALVSTLFGILSIIAWLFAQVPQIYKNWKFQSTSGLSIWFLVEWFGGDVGNLLGALFTHQATWQVTIGAYYVLVDMCLLGQWIWYEKLRHGQTPDGEGRSAAGQTAPRTIFRAPTFDKSSNDAEKSSLSSSGQPATPGGRTLYRAGNGTASSFPSPSPRTMMMIACLIAVVAASPIQQQDAAPGQHGALPQTSDRRPHLEEAPPTALEQAGSLLAWTSTFLYLGSRLPQLLKNWKRKSTAGLSFHLFLAAFCGNFFYSAALLTNPNAWSDFEPYGGGGWAGAAGNDRARWILNGLPFFLGAAGVLGLDASVGIQFMIYGDAAQKLVVLDEETDGEGGGGGAQDLIRSVVLLDADRRSSFSAATDDSRWRWRRVSGWMRGWIPTGSELGAAGPDEREALLRPVSRQGGGGG
ncbi:uncharacterized protein K489DRAFT_295004, partial [Dissoconium aciculare CBS 342.82]|uniref:PQ-loop-domain-containing protein n=1 Tax=Dissoconium aciculare CBS 342.82 TaxID=1314786 RepID=A0A6J3MH43_9PEZI